MNSSDLEYAQSYLIDLMRVFGHRLITVKLTNDGEPVELVASNFVKGHLTKVDIPFPYDEINKGNTRQANTALDNDMLSVLFHEALFEFEEAYLEEMCEGIPQEEAFAESLYTWIDQKRKWLECTFPKYDDEELIPFLPRDPMLKPEKVSLNDAEIYKEEIERLRNLGYTHISHVITMQKLLWDLSFHRQTIGRKLKNAILYITTDEEASYYLTTSYKNFNRFLQARIENDKEGTIKDKNKEINKLIQDYNVKIKEVRKEYQEKTLSLRKELKMHKKISATLRPLLLNPVAGLQKAYDLTTEKGIDQFLTWFHIWKRCVPNNFVHHLENYSYKESGELDLLKQKIEEHNAIYKIVDDDIETSQDSIENGVES